MQFEKLIGEHNPLEVIKGQDKITQVFLEFGTKIDNNSIGTKLGGDPLIFALLVPSVHIATINIPTAATDGRAFYWRVSWIVKKSLLAIRLTCYHEAMHALYMHPQRIGKRYKRIWNMAVDYVVNADMFDDLTIRLKSKEKACKLFNEGLGNYCTIPQQLALFKDPHGKIAGMEHWKAQVIEEVELPAPNEDRPLTEIEKEFLNKKSSQYTYFYADPNIAMEMRSPEKIYDLLYAAVPRCPECGKVGMHLPKPEASQSGGKSKQAGNDQGPAGKESGECGSCGNGKGYDVLSTGETMDTHIFSVETPEEMTKRVSDAIETAKTMAGNVPAGLIEELALLNKPKLRYQDFIRSQLSKARNGNSRNNWSSFKSRPMAMGMLLPKKTNPFAKFICLLDTSSSMNAEEKARGISQLQILDERAEGIVCCADAQVYWEQATKIRNCKPKELAEIKSIGGGGTILNSFFNEYEKRLGAANLLIVITDGALDPNDIKQMKRPKVDTIWLITNGASFVAPFGRAFYLLDD